MTTQNPGPHTESTLNGQITRRQFVSTVGAAAAISTVPLAPLAAAKAKKSTTPETQVASLYGSLTDEQKKVVCFDWDYKDRRGLLRTHVSNNWHITKPVIGSKFFTKDQQEQIEAIFFGLYHPDWRDRIMQQLKDDAGGYGKAQNIAIFGKPGTGKFEFVMTGRHLTIRCDGDSTEHAAFGGPIFYGHAARGFNEKADHPGNVFWPQALKANALYKMLDGKQRKQALVKRAPRESRVHFQGKQGRFSGIPVSELSKDQKAHLEKVLALLIEPYRVSDRKETLKCLNAQGGLDRCYLAFYESGDIGNDGVWDNWRLEGPSFVWHFRGAPHVHVWVNVADNPNFKITTRG
ncbi:MAG: DUF3500 domain-containing protein [Planctomycetaceae bacterium]